MSGGRAPRRTREQALDAALAPVGGGRVLWIDLDPIGSREASGSTRASLDSLPAETFDAAVAAASMPEPSEVARALAGRVRDGGVVALVLPIERGGLRSAAQRAALVFDRSARVRALEDACAALLDAGASRVEVIEIDGARGEVVVHGRLAART